MPTPQNITGIAPRADNFIIGWMIVIHMLALGAVFTFSWSHVLVLIGVTFLSTCLGITLGYHRLLAHRSFKAPVWVERALATCGVLALQGGPLEWVAHHRMHHANTDTDKDPHNARRGFWFSHVGWLFKIIPQFDERTTMRRFARDIASDPYMMWLQKPKVQIGIQTVFGLTVLALWGWQVLLWAVPVRLAFGYNSTWLVNSACHFWGYRRFDTDDLSRNCWWVAVLSWGEGWHNNHHAHPSVAPSGHRWYEFDATYGLIRLMNWVGLAWDIKMPPMLGTPAPVAILRREQA